MTRFRGRDSDKLYGASRERSWARAPIGIRATFLKLLPPLCGIPHGPLA
jgi:hypothetical protein